MINAVKGDMARVLRENGSLRSLPNTDEVPKTPSWYKPNKTTRIPPTLAKRS
jgi:hypothetical protein